jgi:hypothetical protein
MEEPTEADKRLLSVVVDLTERKGGQPPTHSEIAIELGYQSSSRANIYRQLKQLRPKYVDWDSSPRSLHVTAVGLALLKGGTLEADLSLPASDALLPLLAKGLTKEVLTLAEGGIPRAPYSREWNRAMNILGAEYLLHGLDAPSHSAAVVAWCHHPLKQWPISFRIPTPHLEKVLLDKDDEPTDFCREYAYEGDAEMEACQHLMVEVLNQVKLNRFQSAYVTLRRYLIEHPVVTEEELHHLSYHPELALLGEQLLRLYEQVPTTAVDQKTVLTCGFCGWTLVRINGRLRCGDDRCRVLTANFTQGTEEREEPVEKLQRVRRAIRRYVVAPGKYELSAMKQLNSIGLPAELWPNYDQYDLRIRVADDLVWAVDVKDWGFPHLLAKHLKPFEYRANAHWDRAFYVIPDIRVQETPNYMNVLQNVVSDVGYQHDFTILTISQLIEEARKQKETLHA